MEADFLSGTSFEVQGSFEDLFFENRRVKSDCGTDGLKYGTVASSSYSGGKTTVSLSSTSETLTANLIEVSWGRVKPGPEGNQANQWIDGTHNMQLNNTGLMKERADTDPGDYYTEVIRRSRGSFEIPGEIVSGDYLLHQEVNTYLDSDWRNALVREIIIDSLVTSHPTVREVIKGDNGVALVTIREGFGDGIVSHPLQSYVKATRSTAQIIASGGGGDTFQFDSEETDNQDEFDSTTDFDFTAKRAGVYHVSAQVTFAASTNAGSFKLSLLKNSTLEAESFVAKSVDDSNVSVRLDVDVTLSATDTLEIEVYQNSGTGISSTAEDADNFFCIRKVL